ncbi:Pls/PosA family non-ribosomal peptide synthetase [Streptomyces chiangmaiensis]|uniref:Pls/PosA family non-ribosomal peptide synthetase n=1 Tax=Streptomyces chiangmaiensis TaxID=766497 RepID=A0ABU7FSY6_9ACTN|nr:Pls/PosA family non-ribosomal peptide synthetase [Streptomyces chiangmaiensis]MED7827225.1 Pls/PosA family non-ribosomal peptide synthetase [Streptomyces chiangmaiensis]
MVRSAGISTPETGTSENRNNGYVDSPAALQTHFADVLAQVLQTDQVALDRDFFKELGANSLVMAQFCARVRKRTDLPSVSIKDIYQHPTIRSLAAAVGGAGPEPVPEPAQADAPARTSTCRYMLCGAVQLLLFVGYVFVVGLVAARGYHWVAAGQGALRIYLRSVLFGGAGFVALCAFPIAAKWILVGRWKPGEFPLWGLTYLRFWIVRVLVRANPMFFFVGNPLYVLYLRCLGARIGSGVTILSRRIPVCTDLLTIGADTVLRKESFFLCYRAQAGRIQTGRVTLGSNVVIGEKTVLDIDTSVGDGGRLGHASSLHSGQRVPGGEYWHGSPAQRAHTGAAAVPPARCGTARRAAYGLVTLLQVLFVVVPLAVGGSYMLLATSPAIAHVVGTQAVSPGITSPRFYTDALRVSLLVFFGFVVLGTAALCTLPRLLNRLVKPDTVYPLYGLHYSVHRTIARTTNIKFFKRLFGDSSYIVHYLKGLGYKLSPVQQTGSNFGTEVEHDSPFHSTVGTGTMVADGLSVVNADFSSTSFRISRATIGRDNFIGNNIAFPAGARTGDNCLLATKVMVPLEGRVHEGVGLLGSPPFEIPRSVERDSRFDHLLSREELPRHLAVKNRYNLATMGLFLGAGWLYFFAVTILGTATIAARGTAGSVMVAVSAALTLVFTAFYLILVERLVTRFRPLRPQLCSIYHQDFWLHERLWKLPVEYFHVFNGTPFKPLAWRLMGARVGKRVFDDGCYLTDRTLATIGDDCTLNLGSRIQCHSQEDGTFKSDHSTLHTGVTLGVAAHVHYGVTMGEGATLAPDSFLMKGEEVPAGARWHGNPATQTKTAGHRYPAPTP